MSSLEVTSYDFQNQDKKPQQERHLLISANQTALNEYFQRIRGDKDPHCPESPKKAYTLDEECENSRKIYEFASQIWNYCSNEYDHELSAEYSPTLIAKQKFSQYALREHDAAKTLEGLFYYFTKAQYEIDKYRVMLKENYDHPQFRKPLGILSALGVAHFALGKIKFLNEKFQWLKSDGSFSFLFKVCFAGWAVYEGANKLDGFDIERHGGPNTEVPYSKSSTSVKFEKVTARYFVQMRQELLFSELKVLFNKRVEAHPPAYEAIAKEEPSAPEFFVSDIS